MHRTDSLRIIGGFLRSRRVYFSSQTGVRPTPNRVKETLFNWLVSDIPKSICLDMFAGSGSLGFEAMSRGASYCLMLDSSKENIFFLEQNKTLLKINHLDILQATFPFPFSDVFSRKFDIVFIDPPFHAGYISDVIEWLRDSGCLNKNAKLYFETESEADVISLPATWRFVKDKKAGNVRYSLVTCA